MRFALPVILGYSTQKIFRRLWVAGTLSQADLSIELGTGMGIGNSLDLPMSPLTK